MSGTNPTDSITGAIIRAVCEELNRSISAEETRSPNVPSHVQGSLYHVCLRLAQTVIMESHHLPHAHYQELILHTTWELQQKNADEQIGFAALINILSKPQYYHNKTRTV